MVDVNLSHVAFLRRCRFPRAISVASASRCGVQKRRNPASHSSTSRNAGTVHRVQPALTIRPHRGEAVVPQHFQMLRHRGLSDRELVLDGCADRARRQSRRRRAVPGCGAADRIAQDVECVHSINLEVCAYISQYCYYCCHRGGAAPLPKPQVAWPNRGFGWALTGRRRKRVASCGSGSAPANNARHGAANSHAEQCAAGFG